MKTTVVRYNPFSLARHEMILIGYVSKVTLDPGALHKVSIHV